MLQMGKEKLRLHNGPKETVVLVLEAGFPPAESVFKLFIQLPSPVLPGIIVQLSARLAVQGDGPEPEGVPPASLWHGGSMMEGVGSLCWTEASGRLCRHESAF